MPRQIVQLGTIVFASYVLAHAQRMTIPEAVRQMKPRLGSDPYVTSRISELSPLPYDDAVRQADVIVHAKLTELGFARSARFVPAGFALRPPTRALAGARLGSARAVQGERTDFPSKLPYGTRR